MCCLTQLSDLCVEEGKSACEGDTWIALGRVSLLATRGVNLVVHQW